MKAEIIAIGTELLLGQVVNTNAAFISKELALLGIDVFHHSVIGDNPKRIREVIRIAESRADLLIFSGGLGPTKDDLTKKVIADYLDVNLVEDQKALALIKDFYKKANLPMPPSNRNQAMMFEESLVLANENGMAPGVYYEQAGITYAMVPGVPIEMETMITKQLIPLLKEKISEQEIISSRTLRFFGITESQMAEEIDSLIENQTNPTLAIYLEDHELTLRITAKANSQEQAKDMIDHMEKKILEILSPYFFGYGQKRMVERFTDYLLDHELSLSIVEEMTGGYIIDTLSKHLSGHHSLLKGGIVWQEVGDIYRLLDINERKNLSLNQLINQAMRKKTKADLLISLHGKKAESSQLSEETSKLPSQINLGVSFKGKDYSKVFDYSKRKNKTLNLILLDVVAYIRAIIIDK